MEIILRKVVSGLGRTGEVVNVADGYARNFLIPKGMAEEATPVGLQLWEKKRAKLGEQAEAKASDSSDLAGRVNGFALSLKEKVGEEGQLFGSVNAARLSAALKEAGYDVEEAVVLLAAPIKKAGEYEVELKLGDAPYPKIKLKVESEGEEKKEEEKEEGKK